MYDVAARRMLRDAFTLTARWVGCFFLSLLLTNPLRFFAFGVKLALHGMLWRPFEWQEILLHRDVYLASVVAVPYFLLSFVSGKDRDEYFLDCVRAADPSAELLSLPQRPQAVSWRQWAISHMQSLKWGAATWAASYVPYVGVPAVMAIQFFVFQQSLSTLWAAVLVAVSLVAPFSSSFVVFLFVSCHEVGRLLLQPHVFDRFPEQRRVARRNVHRIFLLGLMASFLMSLPLVGGPLLRTALAMGAHLYVSRLQPQLEHKTKHVE